jgi:hypothetical protein
MKMHVAVGMGAVMIAGVALSGCPTQPSYPSTITPIYAAANSGGLWVYNGASWTNYTLASTSNTVVVSGSGAGARAYVGGNGPTGVSQFDGTAWTPLAANLGSPPVNRLFLGSNLYAATSGGLSILNGDGTWTNNGSVTPVLDVCSLGTYTFVAGGGTTGAAGLYVYNGAGLVGGTSIAPVTIVPTSTKVTAVFVDSIGDLIAGTDKGLAVQFAGTGPFVSLLPGTPTVNQICLDTSGNLYAATSVGLYRVGTSAVLVLSGTAALCVCVDGADTIYAGTATGLRVSTNGGLTWTTQLAGHQINSVTTTAPLYSF